MTTAADLLRSLADLEVDGSLAASARDEIDPAVDDSITYFGTRIERELARLTEDVARTGTSGAVDDAAATLAAMLERLRHFSAPSDRGLLDRLWRRGKSGLDAARLKRVESELDQLAGRLEGHSNPILTEVLTLERRAKELDDQLARLLAYAAGGSEALTELTEGSGSYRDLLGRLQELMMARTVALQARATLMVMLDNRRQLQERSQFVLRHALPLWHQQAEFVRRELARSKDEAAARLAAANAALTEALGAKSEGDAP